MATKKNKMNKITKTKNQKNKNNLFIYLLLAYSPVTSGLYKKSKEQEKQEHSTKIQKYKKQGGGGSRKNKMGI